MTYCLVRIYSGSNDRSVEELAQIVGRELAPQLIQGNCRRYSTIKFEDGRLGSSSFYDDQATAKRGTEVAKKWVQGTKILQGYSLDQTIEGEVIYGYHGKASNAKEGEIRLYKSSASIDDVCAAMQQEGQPILDTIQGLVRYTCVKTADGIAVLTANESRESSTEISDKARAARQKGGSKMQAVLGQDPEVLRGTILQSYHSYM